MSYANAQALQELSPIRDVPAIGDHLTDDAVAMVELSPCVVLPHVVTISREAPANPVVSPTRGLLALSTSSAAPAISDVAPGRLPPASAAVPLHGGKQVHNSVIEV